ncbi:hypothetical protein [Paenibacillus marinisediminis]
MPLSLQLFHGQGLSWHWTLLSKFEGLMIAMPSNSQLIITKAEGSHQRGVT